MRPTRSTAAAAIVASVVALLVSRGPWLWAQASPAPARAATPPVQSPPQPAVPPPPQPAAVPAAAPSLATPANGPADSIGPLAGANVTVYLRADAVGLHFTGANMEFRNLVTRRGAFVRSDNYWFILKNEAQEIWIPRTAIALVEMRS